MHGAFDAPTVYFYTPYFQIRFTDGRRVTVYYQSFSTNSTYRQYLPGGATSHGKLVVHDSVTGKYLTPRNMIAKGTYAKYNIDIVNNRLVIKADGTSIYEIDVASTDKINYWEFHGTNAWWNNGAQDGRLKYIKYNLD